jgi:SpoVK/Ycf46/Vps4 family AAA+-type ATPase
MLDGETQIQNVVYVATTNYPERLDKRFVDRPSRFDTIRKIDMPNAEARKAYIKAKLPEADDITISRYVKNTDGYSIAYMRELIVLTQCFGYSFEKSIDRLNGMHKRQPKSDDTEMQSIGFS